ncbi:MAG: drug/metabolite exporter YedA [Inquilinaceae bacterium]
MAYLSEKVQSTYTPMVMACLVVVYIVWGSTYLAIDLTLDTMPPLLMTGSRFIIAGTVLIAILAMSKDGLTIPTVRQLLNCTIVGGSMLGLGVGSIGIAEQTISSGLASVGIATVPIWAVLLSGLFLRRWPNRLELLGIVFGFLGIVLLNLQGGFGQQSIGTVIIVAAALFWALGSVLSQFLDLPKGPTAYAFEMLMGGLFISCIAFVMGEDIADFNPDPTAFYAWMYLIVGGSLFAYSAYMYLLRNVRTSVATSYAFVTPIVAILLGVYFLSETVTAYSFLAMLSVLIGLAFIFKGKEKRPAKP